MSERMSYDALWRLRTGVYQAKDVYEKGVAATFHVGDAVVYEHGGHDRHVEVVAVYGGSLLVSGVRSEYQIDADRVLSRGRF